MATWTLQTQDLETHRLLAGVLTAIETLTARMTHMSDTVSEKLATINAGLVAMQEDSTATLADLAVVKDKLDALLGGTTLSPADRAALDEIAARVTSAVAGNENVKQMADALAGPVAPPPEPEPPQAG